MYVKNMIRDVSWAPLGITKSWEQYLFFYVKICISMISDIWLVYWYSKNRKHFGSHVRVKYLHCFRRKELGRSFPRSLYFIMLHCNFLGISRSIPACSLNFYHNCSSLSFCFFTWLPWCLLNGFCTTLRLTVNVK